jgi:hypothetical protein
MTVNDWEHLTDSEFDSWLDGQLPPARVYHLETCSSCRESAETDRTIALHLSILPRLTPSPEFSDRILNAVAATNPALATVRLHLTPDEMDEWLGGRLSVERIWHLEICDECRTFAEAEQSLVARLQAAPLWSPTIGFADRVMASVAAPAAPVLQPSFTWRSLVATPRARALAAGVATLTVGAMAGSVIWSLTHQAFLGSLGGWFTDQAQQWLWVGFRGAVSNLIEQPWYSAVRSVAGSPARLAAISAGASALYFSGLLAFRRLLLLPLPISGGAGARI